MAIYLLFNLPVGLVVAVLAAIFITDLRSGQQYTFDWPGVTLASAGLLALCYRLVEGQRYDWGVIYKFRSIPVVLAAGTVLIIIFIWIDLAVRLEEPLIPFKILSDRNFGGS